MRRNSNARKVYQAAKKGLLNTIPKDQITKAALRFRTKAGHCVLLWAAMHSQLDLIPPGLLTVNLLLRGTKKRSTPILFAAMSGCLNQIPARLLTQHTLFYELPRPCAFQCAVMMGYANQIPEALLTPANFLKSGRFTTFELVDLNGDLNRIPLQILKACRKVQVRSDKTLEELLRSELRKQLDEPEQQPLAIS